MNSLLQIKALDEAQQEANAFTNQQKAGRGKRIQNRTRIGLISKSERPFVYTGGGLFAAEACNELKTLVEK